jgi:methylated-DNA-[protein]-cysteine S-methyltransferase
MTRTHCRFDTPIGEMTVVLEDDRVRRITNALGGRPEDLGARDDHAGAEVRGQLAEYFDGDRREFELDLDPRGTPFQLELWAALSKVPYAQTVTYGELAERIGRPRAVRAVGLANGRNPFMIVYPCHRVIGANGALTGYAGGLEVKRALLSLEGITVTESASGELARALVAAG